MGVFDEDDIWKIKKAQTQEELEQQCQQYFKDCSERNEPFLVTGLALACGVDRKTIFRWANKKKGACKDYWRRPSIKRAISRCERYAENGLFAKSGMQIAGAVFALKNYGWSDRQGLDISSGNRPIGFVALPALKEEGDTTYNEQSVNSSDK